EIAISRWAWHSGLVFAALPAALPGDTATAQVVRTSSSRPFARPRRRRLTAYEPGAAGPTDLGEQPFLGAEWLETIRSISARDRGSPRSDFIPSVLHQS